MMAKKQVKSTGGSTSYYVLPEGATQLQDLIEFKNMNAQTKEVFKASYRVGEKHGNDVVYDWNKIAYFALREIGRIAGRKDYVTIAKELIADQSVEDENPNQLHLDLGSDE